MAGTWPGRGRDVAGTRRSTHRSLTGRESPSGPGQPRVRPAAFGARPTQCSICRRPSPGQKLRTRDAIVPVSCLVPARAGSHAGAPGAGLVAESQPIAERGVSSVWRDVVPRAARLALQRRTCAEADLAMSTAGRPLETRKAAGHGGRLVRTSSMFNRRAVPTLGSSIGRNC